MLTFLKKIKDKTLNVSLFRQELVSFAVVFIADIIMYLMILKSGFKYYSGENKMSDTIVFWHMNHLLLIFLFVVFHFVYLFTHLAFNSRLIYSDFCKAVFALTMFCIFYLCLSFPFEWVMFMDPPKEGIVSGQYMQGGGFTAVFFIFFGFARRIPYLGSVISSYCLFLLIVASIDLLGWGIKEIIFLRRKRKGGE